MKATISEIKNACLVVTKTLELPIESMKRSLEHRGMAIYDNINYLVYKAFIKEYNVYFEKDNEKFMAFELLRSYAQELDKNGFVEFLK